MKIFNISTLALFLYLLVLTNVVFADDDHKANHDGFVKCLLRRFHSNGSDVYTPRNSSFDSILQFSIQNLRFMTQSTPKPLVIVTPHHESQVPPVILCAKYNHLQLRTRSGGHDYEGVSYVSKVPFAILDLINFTEVKVNATEKTAWVASGVRLGTLYFRIGEQSPTLGFPGGICPTVGIGGHVSGGGYGMLARKYGLASDNVIDARIVNVHGKILDRRSMGEDLFWAIRGSGGTSFGVVLSWKVKLVDVPETVTVFTVQRTLEQNATQLVYRWQDIAHRLHPDLLMLIVMERINSSRNGMNVTALSAGFYALFLGRTNRLIRSMQRSFPELGLRWEDCQEMSWVQSSLFFQGLPIDSHELLLNRTQPIVEYIKTKTDFVQKPIPASGLEGLWRFFNEHESKGSQVIMSPYGGKMWEISEAASPFPYRAGNLYMIQYLVTWGKGEGKHSEKYISWIRRVYSYMAPYVPSSPRGAYINYRDLDIGVNKDVGRTSVAQASNWGKKYFQKNFNRLVRVKSRVDRRNFFRNEQSIPSIHA